MKIIFLICYIMVAVLPSGFAQEPEGLSLLNLIATPEKYDGKKVRVIGFVRLEFEGNAVYLSKDDRENHIFKNGLWISLGKVEVPPQEELEASPFLIEGTFSKNDKGHMGSWSGSINEISRFEQFPTKLMKKLAPEK